MLGRAIITIVILWSAVAHAAYTMNPSTIATPATAVGVTSTATTGSLSTTDTGNPKVDLVLGTCSGAGTGTFALTPSNNIPLQNPATISVTYTPMTPGMRSCNVSVFAMGTTTTALTSFTVTGDGKSPAALALTTPSTQPVVFSPVRVLDTASAGHTSPRMITLTNTGDFAANVSAVTFDSPEFSVTAGTPGSITAGGTRSWTIQFDPSAPGTRNATATFVNDTGTPNFTVMLRGDGTTGLFTLSTNTVNFGTVAAGFSDTADLLLAHSGAAPRGTLTITSASISAATAPWFSVTASPATVGPPGVDSGTVTVKCAPPANATTTETAMLDVTADVDSGPATISASLTCKGGAALLALDKPSVDFGAQLVGTTTPTPQTINITNSGTTTATITLTSTSTNAGRFTVAGPTCSPGTGTCTVAMGASIAVTLTFTPNAEGAVGASFTITVQGQAGAPTTGFTLGGRGIDKHIGIPDAVQFEDTFRNPGTKATVSTITIQNTGEYPLDVTAMTIANNDVDWTLVEPAAPFTIDGLGSQDVVVQFAPHAVGKAGDGILIITNTDTKIANGMPQIVLSGNGKARNVSATPGSIDVGDTFAGVPTRVSLSNPSDLLVLVNNEAPDDSPLKRTDFRINRVEVAGDDKDAFEAIELGGGSLDGSELAAGAMTSVDIVFKPDRVGDFSAVLAVYLDDDTEPQALIPIRGRALWANAHGSGGCSTSPDPTTGGGLLLVLGVVGFATRRRRR